MKKGNHYLCEEVNYTSHHKIFEFVCLEVSNTSYKIKCLTTNHIEWMGKDKFELPSSHGQGSQGYYYIKEDLGEYTEFNHDINKQEIKQHKEYEDKLNPSEDISNCQSEKYDDDIDPSFYMGINGADIGVTPSEVRQAYDKFLQDRRDRENQTMY